MDLKFFAFLCSLLVVICSLLHAQTAAELDRMLETNAVTVGRAARFAFGAAGLLQEGLSDDAAEAMAYNEAKSRGWVKNQSGAAISLQDMAFLFVNVFEIKGGIMYRLFRNPRYAYREMIYQRLIQGRRSYSHVTVDGPRFLQILGRTLNYSGEREEMDAMLRKSEDFR